MIPVQNRAVQRSVTVKMDAPLIEVVSEPKEENTPLKGKALQVYNHLLLNPNDRGLSVRQLSDKLGINKSTVHLAKQRIESDS